MNIPRQSHQKDRKTTSNFSGWLLYVQRKHADDFYLFLEGIAPVIVHICGQASLGNEGAPY